MQVIKLSISLFILSLLFPTAGFSRDSLSSHPRVLDVFIGEWEGTAILYYPRNPAREPREEAVTVKCQSVLKGTYIHMHSTWTQKDGQSRELYTFWSYNPENKDYEIMFLYDDEHNKVSSALQYDDSQRLFSGTSPYTTARGIPATEKVEWHISADGNEITGLEYNNHQTDPPDFWPLVFKFVWKRKQ
jgi:hypothetical protein